MPEILIPDPPRSYPPVLPKYSIELPEVPAEPPEPSPAARWLQILLPLASIASGSLFAFSLGIGGGWIVIVEIGLTIFSIGLGIAVSLLQRQETKRQRELICKRYRAHLNKVREEWDKNAQRQRIANAELHPSIAVLAKEVQQDKRIYERQSDLGDRGIRIGQGAVLPLTTIRLAEQNPLIPHIESLRGEAEKLVRDCKKLKYEPIVQPLHQCGVVSVVGNVTSTRPLVRSILCQEVVFYGPDKVRVMTFTPNEALKDWSWLKWAPHTALLRRTKELAQPEREYLCLMAEMLSDYRKLFLEQIKPVLEQRKSALQRNEKNGTASDTYTILPHLVLLFDTPLLREILKQLPETLGVSAAC